MEPNFTLFSSNQSLDLPRIDLKIAVDAEIVEARDLECGNRKNWHRVEMNLSKGEHVIEATSRAGKASATKAFQLADRKWCAICFWYRPKTSDPEGPGKITIDILDSEPQFR